MVFMGWFVGKGRALVSGRKGWCWEMARVEILRPGASCEVVLARCPGKRVFSGKPA
jgi:hypothetical protein